MRSVTCRRVDIVDELPSDRRPGVGAYIGTFLLAVGTLWTTFVLAHVSRPTALVAGLILAVPVTWLLTGDDA